jgi:hypothetical protein
MKIIKTWLSPLGGPDARIKAISIHCGFILTPRETVTFTLPVKRGGSLRRTKKPGTSLGFFHNMKRARQAKRGFVMMGAKASHLDIIEGVMIF